MIEGESEANVKIKTTENMFTVGSVVSGKTITVQKMTVNTPTALFVVNEGNNEITIQSVTFGNGIETEISSDSVIKSTAGTLHVSDVCVQTVKMTSHSVLSVEGVSTVTAHGGSEFMDVQKSHGNRAVLEYLAGIVIITSKECTFNTRVAVNGNDGAPAHAPGERGDRLEGHPSHVGECVRCFWRER